jgi:hypothetical protein
MKQNVLAIALILVWGVSARAADFGLLLAPAGGYTSGLGAQGFDLNGSLSPWVSAAFSERTSFYFSGKVALKGFSYSETAWTWQPPVEIERAELNFHPLPTVYLILGRQQFRDSAGMISSGGFDGLTGSFGLGRLRLSGGVLYTGWLYKETAEILMTQLDKANYGKPLDYGDFLNTYFASRRMLAFLAGEFPDLSSRTSLNLWALGQFDLNDYSDFGGESALHTQYLEAQYSIEPVDELRFILTLAGESAESRGKAVQGGLAAALGLEWEFPGSLTDLFSLELRWGSGVVSNLIGPFRPVNGIAQGFVFTPTLSGTMNARASYTARLHSSLSFNTMGVFFWRTDVETFQDMELDSASTGRFLGAELYGRFIWAPQSVIQLSAGGGLFFPGGAFLADAPPRWSLNLALVLSL